MKEQERMLAGALYFAGDEELTAARRRAKMLTRNYNATTEDETARREELLRALLGSAGGRIWIEPPFRVDYGSNVTVGTDFYANYDCLILDVAPVTIGDRVMFGPRVCICTAAHPIDAAVRSRGLEYGKPITIGDDVWLGANVTVNPGVTIGSGTVIGSGSVVTRNIPAGVVAAGNPCRVLRTIGEEDRVRWQTAERDYDGVPEPR